MNIPLCVDLDGTLIKSDLLFESFLLLIKKNPLYFFNCIVWLMRGTAYLKQQIALRITLNPATLPYQSSFLEFLKKEKSQGRPLYLVTAADSKLASEIANYLSLFNEVIASDGRINLIGKNKSNFLNQKFGEKQYDYAGNDKNDLWIWKYARHAILVNTKNKLLRTAEKFSHIEAIFSDRPFSIFTFLKLIRVHQYVKNILVFIPLLAGHFYFKVDALVHSFMAFGVFCLVASSVYLLNDLLDITNDRQHKSKSQRAFATGEVSIKTGLMLFPIFLMTAYILSFLYLPPTFVLMISVYYFLTLVYSFYLKSQLLLDVFALAMLYTIRIIAGIAAIDSLYSPWLITFSLFLFLSLAFVKRFSELENLRLDSKTHSMGRSYQVSDLPQLQLFGTTSGYLSVLVLALYINSDKVLSLYRYANFLWIICVFLLFWISRIWMLASRNLLHEDPVVFALKDKVSWCLVLFSGLIILATSL